MIIGAVGILALATALLALGLKGFTSEGFPVTRSTNWQGPSAKRAGLICLTIAVGLLLIGGTQFYVGIVAWQAEQVDHQIRLRAKAIEDVAEYRKDLRERLFFNGMELFLAEKNFLEAAEAFTATMKVRPDADAHLMRVRCWNELGEYEQAIDDASMALEAGPDYESLDVEYRSLFLAHRGFAHYRLSRFDKALDDLSKAIAVAPADWDNLMAYGLRGWIYATCPEDRYISGKKALDDGAHILPMSGKWFVFNQVAAMYARGGNFEIARRAQEYAIDDVGRDVSLGVAERAALTADFQQRLRQYERAQPYRETQPSLPPIQIVY